MISQSGSRFDGWYEQMSGDAIRDELVAESFGLPAGMRVTGLLPAEGLSEVASLLELTTGQVLVDLACGLGGYGLELARSSGCDLIGVDASAVAIGQAFRSAVSSSHAVDHDDRIRFEIADFASTGLPDDIADTVLCIDSYQFASSLESLLGEARRITRPGGRLVITGAMRRAVIEAGTSPVERALIESGWGRVRIDARPEWLAIEERFWTRVINESRSTPALEALRSEARELLPALPHLQRFIAVAVNA